MEKIYVIVSGYYSDWNIEGYAETEEDAMKLCAQHNVEEKSNDWHYVPATKLLAPKRVIPMRYVHTVDFHETEGSWVMLEYDGDFDYYAEDMPNCTEQSTITSFGKNLKKVRCKIILRENDRKKAEKIAQDMLYPYLLEQEKMAQIEREKAAKYLEQLSGEKYPLDKEE